MASNLRETIPTGSGVDEKCSASLLGHSVRTARGQAVIWHEDLLANHPEFARCTEQLANMMQHLTGSAQPRADKADFLEVLRNMAEHSQKTKEFAKKVYDDYRAKNCTAGDAYKRFEEGRSFEELNLIRGTSKTIESDEKKTLRPCNFSYVLHLFDFRNKALVTVGTVVVVVGLNAQDLTPVELQLCYDEYREDPEVREAWNKAGVENSLLMAASVQSLMRSGGATASTAPQLEDKEKKGKKIKTSEIELMVDEMKRLCEACREAAKVSGPWKADLATQMVQALASASVERRYGCSPEDMTMAGLQNAPTLQKNERFFLALLILHLGVLISASKLRTQSNVGIVVVGDPSFQRRFDAQIRSLRCYANRHGYEMHLLTASEYAECKRFKDFFFRKHCTVSKFLETQAPSFTAAVFDGDVVVAAPMHNGAIQLVVMETIQVEGYNTCYSMYRNLTDKVTNLNSYWDYVHCTKEAIGPARAWTLPKGRLTMWPRLEFYVADGVFLNRWASSEIGPIMHHGVKDPQDVVSFYYKDLDQCEINETSVLRSAKELGETALHLAQSYPEYFPAGRGCKQCAETCMERAPTASGCRFSSFQLHNCGLCGEQKAFLGMVKMEHRLSKKRHRH
eukprot:g19123.t1